MERRFAHGNRSSGQAGFSLLEVLVAILILVIGLVGVAHMQAVGLTQTQSAYNRSQATLLAYDMADRMRANLESIGSYVTIALADATAQAGCTTTDGCTIVQMAENDLFEWNQDLTGVLPGGSGAIAVDDLGTVDPEDDIYTVSVTWIDDNQGASTTFDFSFRPVIGE